MLRLPGFLYQTRLTEHKRATRNDDANNHIAVHHQLTNHNTDWDSAQCLTCSTNYFQRLTLESWYTNIEQTPLNRCQTTYPWPKRNRQTDFKQTDLTMRTKNRPIWLTIDGSKPPNDWWQTLHESFMAKLTNQVQRTNFITLIKCYSLDSKDDFRSGCRNVSHQQQFFSELPSPRRSHTIRTTDTPGIKPFTIALLC